MKHAPKHIFFNVNNKGILEVAQEKADGAVTVTRWNDEFPYGGKSYSYDIPNGDFIMLLNLYKYVKENDIKSNFINPKGAFTDAL